MVETKAANFAIDLPDASMAIQISGTYGSRQEEAQRLGRILRPKSRTSRFYTLVSNDTREQEFAWKRQRFLVEQGYRYQIVHWQSSSDDIDEIGHASFPICFDAASNLLIKSFRNVWKQNQPPPITPMTSQRSGVIIAPDTAGD